MPVSRLRALSACSKLFRVQPGTVVVERKFAAVPVLQLPAVGLEILQQLQHQRARQPYRVERVGAAHVVGLLLERLDLDRARPAPVALLARPADLQPQLHALAGFAHADHLELGDQVLHQGIAEPSCEKNLPESAGFRPATTLRSPRTDASGESGAPSPPMSVRTQPGLSATTTTFPASVAARPLTSMLSAALLVE